MNTVFQANGNRAQRVSLPLGAVPMPPAPAARGLRLTTVLSCILVVLRSELCGDTAATG